MILKAQQGDSLSSGKLTLYAFDDTDHPVGCAELSNYDRDQLETLVKSTMGK